MTSTIVLWNLTLKTWVVVVVERKKTSFPNVRMCGCSVFICIITVESYTFCHFFNDGVYSDYNFMYVIRVESYTFSPEASISSTTETCILRQLFTIRNMCGILHFITGDILYTPYVIRMESYTFCRRHPILQRWRHVLTYTPTMIQTAKV